jgi:type II secretory pathway predicted ATPase ExeA/LysM repeat protein
MYNSYFGFSNPPFENNHDQEFLFLSEGHKEVLAALVYFIKAKKAFAMVCGDVGTGKTMLIHCFLQRLPESVRPIVVSNPFVGSMDLLRYVARALNLPDPQEGILELSDQVKQALAEARSRDEQVVLMVDEAHLLSEQSLEEIRLLSNLETPNQNLLQILLVGQHELSHKLGSPAMRPLRQRININRFLSPLNPAETIQYVDHRLQNVGASFATCFEPACGSLLHKMTGGVPRRLNQLCDNALLICMTEKQRKVSRKILRRADEAVKTDVILTPKGPRSTLQRVLRPALIVLAIGALLALGGISGHLTLSGERLRQASQRVPQERLNPGEIKNAAAIPPQKGIVSGPGEKGTLPRANKGASTGLPVNSPDQDLALKVPGLTTDRVQVDQNGLGPNTFNQDSRAGNQPGTPPRQVMVKPGESLEGIASRHYPDHSQMGLLAILVANRNDIKDDMIHPGQTLHLPKVKLAGQMMQLDDNLFYTPYGRYSSPESLRNDTTWLKKKQVRFLVIRSRDSQGKTFHRVVFGGYIQEMELQETFLQMKTKLRSDF